MNTLACGNDFRFAMLSSLYLIVAGVYGLKSRYTHISGTDVRTDIHTLVIE